MRPETKHFIKRHWPSNALQEMANNKIRSVLVSKARTPKEREFIETRKKNVGHYRLTFRQIDWLLDIHFYQRENGFIPKE